MGAGAVKGVNENSVHISETQNQGDSNISCQTNFNHNTGGGDSQPAPPTIDDLNEPLPELSPLAASDSKSSSMKMSCEKCSVNFTLFRRKKCCQECHRFFCSTCLPKPRPTSTSSGRQCSKCRLLVSGHFSRDDLKGWKINDMRCFLNVRNISTQDCREKHDLIDIVLSRFCTRPRQSIQQQAEHEDLVRQMADNMRNVSFVQESSCDNSSAASSNKSSPSTTRNEGSANVRGTAAAAASSSSPSANSTANNSTRATGTGSSTSAPRTTEGQEERDEGGFSINTARLGELLQSLQDALEEHIYGDEPRQETQQTQPSEPDPPAPRRTQLEDIASVSAIDSLTNRQMKELLINNFVDYKDCIEKEDLIARTKRLWVDHQENKARAERIHKQEEADYYGENSQKSSPPSKPEEEISGEKDAENAATCDSIPDATEASKTTAATTTTDVPPETATATSSSTSKDKDKYVNDSLCSICMDSLVDCIMLECGHMVTCTQCGKRLASCPVCRQYVVRVVRVFRS